MAPSYWAEVKAEEKAKAIFLSSSLLDVNSKLDFLRRILITHPLNPAIDQLDKNKFSVFQNMIALIFLSNHIYHHKVYLYPPQFIPKIQTVMAGSFWRKNP